MTSSWNIKVCLSVGERWRVVAYCMYQHTRGGGGDAALIIIFIQQPVSQADSLFISDFTAVSRSLVAQKQAANYTLGSGQTTVTVLEPVGSDARTPALMRGGIQRGAFFFQYV